MKSITASVVAALLALPASVTATIIQPTNNTYDYIVVGSGPGGGPLASNLARKGHSVLLVEAGDDQSANMNTVVANFFPFAYTDPTLRWDFYAFNYHNETRNLQHNHLVWRRTDGTYYVGREPPVGAELLGIHYPRGKTLGGSSTVNAMNTILPGDGDWQHVVDLTGDQSWNPANMRNIFKRIERNHYLTPGTHGHGFNGYLDTAQAFASTWEGQDDLLTVLSGVSSALGNDPANTVDHLIADVNYLDANRDHTDGIWGSALHADDKLKRFTSRDYVLATANAKNSFGFKKYPLFVQLNTLATKVLFKDSGIINKTPKAIGIEYLEGSYLYSADPAYNASQQGTPGRAYARKEVILSGGAFNSPQLLKLSGIGPADELAQHGIPLVKDLPGVGARLQDNYEVPIVGHAQRDFVQPPPATTPSGESCTFNFGPPGTDPCLNLWLEKGTGPYSLMSTLNAIFRKTPYVPPNTYNERDMYLVGGYFALRGFYPPTDSIPMDPPNTFGLSTVKIHPQSTQGTVRLRSADPRDTPIINFNLFPAGNEAGNDLDLNAELDTIKWARRIFATIPGPIGPILPSEPPCLTASGLPDADGSCDDETDKEWVRNQIFGHHPTSTCAIGADSDPMAVLDSKFRVRGVKGLRVVDASSFPRVPGAFPVLPTFMISEKASDVIAADAGLW